MRGGEKGGLEGGSPLPGLTEEQTVAVTRQANIYWTLAFIARLFKLYNSLSCHHLNDWSVPGWPLRSQPSRTLPRLAPTLPLHPGLPFHSLRPRWVITLSHVVPIFFFVLRGLMTRFLNSVLLICFVLLIFRLTLHVGHSLFLLFTFVTTSTSVFLACPLYTFN